MLSHCLVSQVFQPKVRILRRGRLYTFGRDAKAELRLPSDVVSRRHAEVEWIRERGTFILRDLGSKNGTRVNGVPVVGERPLREGDTIAVGPFTVSYREYEGDMEGLLAESEEAEQTAAISRDAIADGLAAGPPGFAGNFAGHELLEICRLIAFGEKDGVLTVEAGDPPAPPAAGLRGQITFKCGDIVAAEAADPSAPQAAGLRGEEAAYRLLSAPHGHFEFVAGAAATEPVCRLRVESIAMEAARRLDERSARPLPSLSAGQSGETTVFVKDEDSRRKRTPGG